MARHRGNGDLHPQQQVCMLASLKAHLPCAAVDLFVCMPPLLHSLPSLHEPSSLSPVAHRALNPSPQPPYPAAVLLPQSTLVCTLLHLRSCVLSLPIAALALPCALLRCISSEALFHRCSCTCLHFHLLPCLSCTAEPLLRVVCDC